MGIQDQISADHEEINAAQKMLDAAKEKLAAHIASDPGAPMISWFAELDDHIHMWPSELAAELQVLVTKGKNLLGLK